MRKFLLIAAIAVVSAPSAQAGDPRSLSLAGIDEKIPAALGKAAGAPKIVEAPKPPDPPKAAETAKPAEEPKADQPPSYVARPSAIGTKPAAGKAGQVTFEDDKPVIEKERRTAKADKPRRKRGHGYWNEARIMRELARYGIYW